MTTPETTLTFYAAEADPASDLFPEPIDGRFSRLAWLPQLGPTAWLIWSAVATDAHTNSPTITTLAQLAADHGVGTEVARRAIGRLERFRIATLVSVDIWTVRRTAPPLSAAQLRRLPARVTGIQADLMRTHAGNQNGAPAVRSR
jgi:hypothetical protein